MKSLSSVNAGAGLPCGQRGREGLPSSQPERAGDTQTALRLLLPSPPTLGPAGSKAGFLSALPTLCHLGTLPSTPSHLVPTPEFSFLDLERSSPGGGPDNGLQGLGART